jgi:NADH:ubiquinone oxidoreductase subunit 2 (subunit N)
LKYAAYIGIIAALLLILFCFIPWAYYPDIQQNFTGFYSKQNTYGKPGKTLIFLSAISILLFLLPKLWAKRINQFICILIFAYALKTFILFSASYNTYTPEIKPGLIGILLFSLVILVSSLLSKGEAGKEA